MEPSLLLTLLPPSITVVTSLVLLAYWLGRKFEETGTSINRLNDMVDRVSDSLSVLSLEVDKLRREISGLGGSIGRLGRHVRSLSMASLEVHRTIIDYLSLKGLLDEEEAEYLRERAKGVLDLYRANPLKEEELKFLKEVFSSDLDEVSIGDAEKAYEIGKKLFVEEGDERGQKCIMIHS